MQETRVHFLGRKDPLEKEMATHSSILTWRIPWTKNPSSQNQKVEWWLSGAKENGGEIGQGYKLSIIR